MKRETMKEASYLKQNIEKVELQLKKLEYHSFGFGTCYRDIDNTLRPVAEQYLKTKLEILLHKLNNL